MEGDDSAATMASDALSCHAETQIRTGTFRKHVLVCTFDRPGHCGTLGGLELLEQFRQEVDRLSGDPRQVRLFLECWAFGTRRRAIRRKISLALEHYREAFRSLAAEVLRAEVTRFPGVTPEGLAAIAVSLINGCSVQVMIDPDHFDVGEYLTAVEGILGRLPMAA